MNHRIPLQIRTYILSYSKAQLISASWLQTILLFNQHLCWYILAQGILWSYLLTFIFANNYCSDQKVFEKNIEWLQYIQIWTGGQCWIHFSHQVWFHVVHCNYQSLVVLGFINHLPLPPKIQISNTYSWSSSHLIPHKNW